MVNNMKWVVPGKRYLLSDKDWLREVVTKVQTYWNMQEIMIVTGYDSVRHEIKGKKL